MTDSYINKKSVFHLGKIARCNLLFLDYLPNYLNIAFKKRQNWMPFLEYEFELKKNGTNKMLRLFHYFLKILLKKKILTDFECESNQIIQDILKTSKMCGL